MFCLKTVSDIIFANKEQKTLQSDLSSLVFLAYHRISVCILCLDLSNHQPPPHFPSAKKGGSGCLSPLDLNSFFFVMSVNKIVSIFSFFCYEKIKKIRLANLFAHLSGKPGISI
jgi:hypothetical protein